MINRRAQQGMSYWGVMFGIILAVLVVKGALITWPAYWDNRLINQTIEDRLKASTDANPDAFMKSMDEQFSMNSIRDLNAKDVMKASNDGGSLVVQTDYEVRKNFMGNLDMVMSFKKQFDQRALKSGG